MNRRVIESLCNLPEGFLQSPPTEELTPILK